MATYGSNNLAVRLQRELVDEPQKKSYEMPAASMMGSFMPGGREAPRPGRAGPKNQPWRSWLEGKRPGVKARTRSKRKKGLSSLMG